MHPITEVSNVARLHGIIFNGFVKSRLMAMPTAGPYRLRTHLANAGYGIEVVDYLEHWTDDEIMEVISDRYGRGMLFVGFSVTFGGNVEPEILSRIRGRWPDLRIIIGGSSPNENIYAKQKRFQGLVDGLFYGHAENALLEYIRHLAGEQNRFRWHGEIGNGTMYAMSQEDIPYDDTDDLSISWQDGDPVHYVKALPIEISRGCIFKCKFCNYRLTGKKKFDYIRGVDNLADEFKRNHDMYGIRTYMFSDDTFNDSNHKLDMVAKAIARSGVDITFSAYIRYELLHRRPEQIGMLADMGMHAAVVGVESMNENARKAIGKGLDNDELMDVLGRLKASKRDLLVNTNFIIGLPEDSIDSILAAGDWLLGQSRRYLDSWWWRPLGISNNRLNMQSEIGGDPGRYGYEMDPNGRDWRNSYTDSGRAAQLADRLNDAARHVIGPRSFEITNILGLGVELEHAIGKSHAEMDYADAVNDVAARYKRGKLP